MHLIHGCAFFFSAAAMALLVFAMPLNWYQTHAEPSKTRAISPYAHAMDVHLGLFTMNEEHRGNGWTRRARDSWSHHLGSAEYRRQPFCPLVGGPSNEEAHNEVSMTAGLAIMAAILCQAYVVLGLLYATNKLPSRAAFIAAGVLTSLCAFAAVGLWTHFLSLCGEYQCSRIGTGANNREHNPEDYLFQCGVGLGAKLEFIAPIAIALSMILFAVKAPKGTVTYEPVNTKTEL